MFDHLPESGRKLIDFLPATASATATAWLTRTRFIHFQRSTVMLRTIESLDGRRSFTVIRHAQDYSGFFLRFLHMVNQMFNV